MEHVGTPILTARESLDEARRHITEARTAIDTVAEISDTAPRGLEAIAFGIANLLGAVRLGLGRADVADAALEHAMSAVQAWDTARRRGFWARRAFAEDLRTCLTELVLAAEMIAGVLHDFQPHASEETHEAVDVAPFMLAMTRDALAVRRPGMSAGDILDGVALNLRLLVDTCDGLRRGLEAALIQWERDPE